MLIKQLDTLQLLQERHAEYFVLLWLYKDGNSFLFSTKKHNTFRKPLKVGRKQQAKSQNKSMKLPVQHEDTENLNIGYYSM